MLRLISAFGFALLLCRENPLAMNRVFILAGQSNMQGVGMVSELGNSYQFDKVTLLQSQAGETTVHAVSPMKPGNSPGDAFHFGPEVGIARKLTARFPDDEITLIKISYGNTGLKFNWIDDNGLYMGNDNGNIITKPPNVYTWFLERYREALTMISGPYQVQGMIWMQGEFDTGQLPIANAYCANLVEFVNAKVRKDVGLRTLPFVYGVIHNEMDPATRARPWNFGGEVQDQQRACAAKVGFARVDATPETPLATVYKVYDDVTAGPHNWYHFDANGLLVVGDALGEAMIRQLTGHAAIRASHQAIWKQ